ncbi:hypothetical protein AMTRI_Chr02g221500 [Amborella trichopoda]|uniref:Heparan-alpha-glucosaminide N-acetyltransferase catalytic domain-containing protein n=1 Tax=Amborella trichopoda TaxID=13333 RepID=U5D3H9_AMBTC|nr:heparan-alpha-glucosaminide N-acetyltransferase [Amborella trichopoda]XP_020529785.1 heparan-alpha-glucosaminide N-acetyltransferase [Amborella trichopoda]ERN16800.1 hypothetical protein AMTR_s00057p00089970 [Amborella trichopoda]|eukprot:XP_020529784.1 heparan-alpha-glucosaminide N-acetyltransferase [Amborella trichopoda]
MASVIGPVHDRNPLLLEHQFSSSSTSPHHEIEPEASTEEREKENSNRRIASVDVFRGLTVALMILVDDAGGTFPSINHSPWFGVTLADFVMPFFLFIVGVSIGLVFKKMPAKLAATRKVLIRTIKLFLLGVILQGGYFHGLNDLTYGVDLQQIRWLGVLQRISIGYFLAAICEIWLVGNVRAESALGFVKKYFMEWLVAVLLCSLYAGLLYGLYVSNWEFEVPGMHSNMFSSNYKSETIVHCEVRGSLGPPCNAVGLIDRFLLGEKHLYQHPVYRRKEECSINSPDYGPLPPNSPVWCLAPFDPEGILSSVSAIVTCFAGLQYGHILVGFKSHMTRILLWTISSSALLGVGFVLLALGMPISKPLYTLSYMCITVGTGGFLFIVIYYIVDVCNFRRSTILLEWMGMNALIVYALAACDLFPAAIQGFYWRSPANNLVSATEWLLETLLHSKRWGKLAFVLLGILFWCIVAGFLHKKRIYVKF